MELEPRHIFFIVFLGVSLTIIMGIGDGVIDEGGGALNDLMTGDLSERLTALWHILSFSYDWMPLLIQLPFKIINLVSTLLILRQLWKLVPVIGR